MSEIQTPETDEVLRRNAESDQTPQEDYEILADHAANLEYRLAEAREQIAELETRHAATMLHTQAIVDDANSIREQRDRLAEALGSISQAGWGISDTGIYKIAREALAAVKGVQQ